MHAESTAAIPIPNCHWTTTTKVQRKNSAAPLEKMNRFDDDRDDQCVYVQRVIESTRVRA